MELTILGIIILVAALLTWGENKVVVSFLAVILLSMIILNWSKIRPILIKGE